MRPTPQLLQAQILVLDCKVSIPLEKVLAFILAGTPNSLTVIKESPSKVIKVIVSLVNKANMLAYRHGLLDLLNNFEMILWLVYR